MFVSFGLPSFIVNIQAISQWVQNVLYETIKLSICLSVSYSNQAFLHGRMVN